MRQAASAALLGLDPIAYLELSDTLERAVLDRVLAIAADIDRERQAGFAALVASEVAKRFRGSGV